MITIDEAIDQAALNMEHMESLEADFEKQTWLFKTFVETRVGAGSYIVMRHDDWLAFLRDIRAALGKGTE